MSTFSSSNDSTSIKHHPSGGTYTSSEHEKPMYLKVPSPNNSMSGTGGAITASPSASLNSVHNPLGGPLGTYQENTPNVAIRMSPTAPSLLMEQTAAVAGGASSPTTARYPSPNSNTQAAMLLAGSVPNTFPMHVHSNVLNNTLAGGNASLCGDTGMTAAVLQNSVSGHRADDGYRFHVRVLVPCYKEPLEVVSATLNAARGAYLPEKTKRTM